MDATGISPLDVIQAGGVLAFAGLVWFELRLIRPILAALREQNTVIVEWARSMGTPPFGVRIRAKTNADK